MGLGHTFSVCQSKNGLLWENDENLWIPTRFGVPKFEHSIGHCPRPMEARDLFIPTLVARKISRLIPPKLLENYNAKYGALCA